MCFHKHKWKTIKVEEITITENNKTIGYHLNYILQCEICGKIKHKQFIL